MRMLQTMEFQRVGGSRTISVDVRVIAATNRDLLGMVKKQRFRKDLWFRLSVFPIRIPPLRERKQDIPDLAEYFVRRKSMEMNLPRRPAFAPGAMEQLMAYDWPGNVRGTAERDRTRPDSQSWRAVVLCQPDGNWGGENRGRPGC